MKALKIIAMFMVALLAILYFGARYMATSMEKENVFSVSEIRNDDSTYKYVKEQCDSGFFGADSENCQNLREAR